MAAHSALVTLVTINAAAFLIATVVAQGGTSSSLPWEERKYYHKSHSLTSSKLKSVAALSDMARMRRVDLAPLLRVRVPGTPGIAAVRQHIITRLQDLDFTVDVDRFHDRAPSGENVEFVNVVATLNPAAPRRLVLACHYDSKNDTGFIGATDSSVPCAMLLDLAHTLGPYLRKSKESDRDLTLQLVFFDGEEAFNVWSNTDSLYGARHLAHLMQNTPHPHPTSYTNLLDSMDMLVLLDLLGTQDCHIYSMFDDTKPQFERLMRIEKKLHDVGMMTGTTRIFRNQRSYAQGGVEDDHLPFLHGGVRILHIIPVPFPSVWHKPTDNESALHYPTIDNLSKIIRVFVAEYLHLSL